MAKLQTKTGRHISVWTKEKVSEFKKLYKTQSQIELANHFGVTLRSIKGLASKHNVTKRIRGWTKQDEDYLLKNWENLTGDQLAAHFKKTRSAINRRYKALTN